MSPLPRSAGYGFLACFVLATLAGGASAVAVACCVVQAGLLVLATRRPGSRRWVLPTQLPLNYLPFVLGDTGTNLDCLLAAAALRCLSRRVRWPVFLVIQWSSGFVHGAGQAGPGEIVGVAAYTGALGIVIHSLLLLPDLVARLTASKGELARITRAQERLRADESLRLAMSARLSDVMELLAAARRELGERPERARTSVLRAAAVTRRLIAAVRDTAAGNRDLRTAPGDPEPVAKLAPRLTMAALIFGLTAWTAIHVIEGGPYRVLVALGGLTVSGLLLAQLFRPQHTTRLLLAQAAVTLLPLPWLGSFWTGWLTLLTATVLLTQPGLRALVVSAGLLTLHGLFPEPDHPPGMQVGWLLPAVEVAFAVLGLASFWQVSNQLNQARAAHIRLTVQVERLRMARDIHDLLGLTLSVLAIKSDLIAEIIAIDRDRAAAEIDEALRIAAEARREKQAITGDPTRSSLHRELATATTVLADNHIRVELSCDDELPDAGGDMLGPVVREAVTNILRHSAATRVVIVCRRQDTDLRLSIRNDGAVAGSGGGQGLANMRARVAEAGGRFETAARPPEFLLTATVPVGAYAECTVPAGDSAREIDGVRTTPGSAAM